MQFGFAGSPAFAATILQSLIDSGRSPLRVFTQPSRATGRGRKIRKTEVHDLADENDIPVRTSTNLSERLDLFTDLDVLFVAAYGLILPAKILNGPRLGCINVHASLLPRWRGASPVEHAILHGDPKTGVSIMQIEQRLDAGSIYRAAELTLTGTETTESLTHELAALGATELLKILKLIEEDRLDSPIPQEPRCVTYAPRLTAEDARVHWDRSAIEIERQTRAFFGRSAAFTTKNDLRLRIVEAEVVDGDFLPGTVFRDAGKITIGCGGGGLKLKKIQLNRGKGLVLPIEAAVNGYPDVFHTGFEFE